ncbi:2-polyprenyl-6-methoxyphenol hydroxylase [Legionella beliardensis]|uniref:2-polyprenyl-6-methoxyphenol hydroxylase n=1 Tax=Legionella beliardensis TaxID=91822 RepID=A0A378HX83_9GAMM|nr:FAD-dependent monooxygenase [Legionella beliardensis]STX27517.1 2-polyprenyl-6-methoxyphenol hydroxylase [Legionella beliardensis]
MEAHQFEVIIAGGGIVGLTAALAMARRDFHVALIDASDLKIKSLENPDLRVYAVNHASQCLLKQLGAWDRLDKSRISPYRHMHVWDATTQACIDFDARLIANTNLGAIIEEAVIKNALLECLASENNVTVFSNHRITNLTRMTQGLTVASQQQTWNTRLLLVTDGGNSPIRNMLNVPVTSWPYHQHALVATVQTEKKHQKTAYQVFNRDGPLAFLPLANETCSIVWSTTPSHVNHLMSLSPDKFEQALSEAFAYKLGQVNLLSERHQFPLVMRHAKQYVGENWLLMGDAAHTIHPLAGLGLNVGLADVTTWLNCLDKTSNKNFSKSKMASYQRQRKHAVWQVITLMGGLKTLFANPLPPIIALRKLGLNACNQLTPLKRMLIEQAVGQELN